MNETSAAVAATTTLELSALKALQDILHNRIMQKKGEIHESHNKMYNENVWREIKTLHWVLAQILTLKKNTPLEAARNQEEKKDKGQNYPLSTTKKE